MKLTQRVFFADEISFSGISSQPYTVSFFKFERQPTLISKQIRSGMGWTVSFKLINIHFRVHLFRSDSDGFLKKGTICRAR
jgi:hypothetical protein